MAISFINLPKSILKGKKRSVKLWLHKTAHVHGSRIEQLNFNFCSDADLLEINKKFLNHNTYTDIITFDYSEKQKIAGEIYISTDRVTENAEKFSSAIEIELLRVLVHGVLHLCGFKDKSSVQKRQMRKNEDAALKNLRRMENKK